MNAPEILGVEHRAYTRSRREQRAHPQTPAGGGARVDLDWDSGMIDVTCEEWMSVWLCASSEVYSIKRAHTTSTALASSSNGNPTNDW